MYSIDGAFVDMSASCHLFGIDAVMRATFLDQPIDHISGGYREKKEARRGFFYRIWLYACAQRTECMGTADLLPVGKLVGNQFPVNQYLIMSKYLN